MALLMSRLLKDQLIFQCHSVESVDWTESCPHVATAKTGVEFAPNSLQISLKVAPLRNRNVERVDCADEAVRRPKTRHFGSAQERPSLFPAGKLSSAFISLLGWPRSIWWSRDDLFFESVVRRLKWVPLTAPVASLTKFTLPVSLSPMSGRPKVFLTTLGCLSYYIV